MFGLLSAVVSTAVDCFKQRQETKSMKPWLRETICIVWLKER